MERLTEKHYNSNLSYIKCSENCHGDIDCIDCPAFEKIVDRLSDYEDTGLSPEEVSERTKWIPASETPKCPYCGNTMDYQFDSSLMTNKEKIIYRGYFCCSNCHSRSPVVSELSELETIEEVEDEARLMAMERAEAENCVLTLEEVKAYCDALGADAAPLWYEGKHKNSVNRWMLIDVPEFVCDSTMTVKHLLTVESFIKSYGKTCRLWRYKPTNEEMEGTPWA